MPPRQPPALLGLGWLISVLVNPFPSSGSRSRLTARRTWVRGDAGHGRGGDRVAARTSISPPAPRAQGLLGVGHHFLSFAFQGMNWLHPQS